MFRWLLLTLALLVLAVGFLTVLQSPAWLEWRLAILAGEYGFYFAPVPLGLAALAWLSRGSQMPVTVVTVFACALAVGLLLKPVVEAAQIAQGLPARLDAAFGPVTMKREPFSPAHLVGAGSGAGQVETMAFADGLLLDFYRPVGSTARPVPCVVVVHGGGWNSGERTQLAAFNHRLASLGYGVAAVSYRLAPKFIWPAQRDDVMAALAFLKAKAREIGIDPERIVLLGRSAGGQIAEVVAYAAMDPAIRGLVGLYAPSDLNFAYAHAEEDDVIKSPSLMRQFLGGSPDAAKANYDSASALAFVSANSPPTLLLHGQLDGLVWHRHSERLAARLTEMGVKNCFVSMPWATHAFEANLDGPGGQLTTYALEWFLAAVTQERNVPPERE